MHSHHPHLNRVVRVALLASTPGKLNKPEAELMQLLETIARSWAALATVDEWGSADLC